MKGMFEKDFLKMEEGSDSNYPTSYPCKIEDGVEMGFVDQIEMDYQNKSFFPEEFDYEDESLTESRTFEKIEIKTEEDERKLLASYKQLTKRKPLEGPKRKLRLKGEALLNSLRAHPVFKEHDELFDHNLDDKTRKKVMQKIRNRISAQESRDRKKNQFNQLVNNNIQLIESSLNMKKRYENLQRENEMLRAKLQPQEPQDKLLRLNSLFGSISKKGSRTELKPFSLFILTMLIYSILRPEKGTFSDHIASTENVIAGSSIPLTENIVGKIESLCNEFAKKLGMDAEFLFKEKLFGKKSEFDFNSILNLGDEMNQPESNSAEAERSQIELETELRKQFYTIFQESLNSDYYQYDNDSSDHEYTKSQSSSREDGKSSMEIEMGTTENNY